MTCKVVFSPEAEEQLVELYHYIANVASRDIAARYTDAESQKGVEDRPS
jgi:plasmid stabilization system protein ParE